MTEAQYKELYSMIKTIYERTSKMDAEMQRIRHQLNGGKNG